MPDVVSNRIAVIVAAAVILGGAATAVAVAFPGRAGTTAISAPPVEMVATPEAAQPTVAPTPSPTPTPAPTAAPQVYTPRRSTTVARPQPTRPPSGGGGGDVSQLPGPAQKAVGDPPAQPDQPGQPDPPD